MPTTAQAGTEADAREGEILRKLWKHDVEDRIAFAKDQADNGKINFNSDNSIKSNFFFQLLEIGEIGGVQLHTGLVIIQLQISIV